MIFGSFILMTLSTYETTQLYFLRIYNICFYVSNENPGMTRERKAKVFEGAGKTMQTWTYEGGRHANAGGGQQELGPAGGRGAAGGAGGSSMEKLQRSLAVVVCCPGNVMLKD